MGRCHVCVLVYVPVFKLKLANRNAMRIPKLRTPINRRIHHCLAIKFLVGMAILLNIVRACSCVSAVCLCICTSVTERVSMSA